MWKPRWGAIHGIQSPEAGLLLANHEGGLHGVHPKMRQMPTIFTSVKSYPEYLISMTSPWLFEIWEIDLIGRFPKGKSSV